MFEHGIRGVANNPRFRLYRRSRCVEMTPAQAGRTANNGFRLNDKHTGPGIRSGYSRRESRRSGTDHDYVIVSSVLSRPIASHINTPFAASFQFLR